MDFYLGRNRAFAQLGQATLNGSDTNVALVTGHGDRLTQVTTASGLKVKAHIIERDPDTKAVIKCELIHITNNVSDSLIIERAVEATRATDTTNTYAATPQTFTSAAYIEEVISVSVIKQIADQVNAVEAAGLKVAGGSMTGPLNLKAGASIASAGSMDLSAITGNSADVTGTTTIVSLGGSSLPTGAVRELTFTASLTITHNATTLILPNAGTNVVTAAGDVAVFRHLGSGNWKCTDYQPANGQSLSGAIDVEGKSETTDPLGSGFLLLSNGGVLTKQKIMPLFLPDVPAGEILAGNNPCFLPMWRRTQIIQQSQNTTVTFGYNTSNQYFTQSVTIPAGFRSLKKITFSVSKNGSPTRDLVCKCYTWTGSGLVATSQNTINEASLSGWYQNITFDFNDELVTPGTLVYFTVEHNGANSVSNYLNFQIITSNQYAGGWYGTVTSGGTYNMNTGDALFYCSLEDGTKGKAYKATSADPFMGFAKKPVASLPGDTNIVVDGLLTGLSLGNETASVASTLDINATTTSQTNCLTIYTGASVQGAAFLTGPQVANLEKLTVYLTQQGTGGGIITASVYETLQDYFWQSIQQGPLIGSATINSPTNWADNVFTFASPLAVEANRIYIVRFTAASGNVSNYWGLSGHNAPTDTTDPYNRMFTTNTSWTWQLQSAGNQIRLATYYTLKRNYFKWDLAYLSDTAGNIETNRGVNMTYLRPIGTIIDSSRVLCETFSGEMLIATANWTSAASGAFQGPIPIPRNTTRVVVDVTLSTSDKHTKEFKIADFDGTQKTEIVYTGAGFTYTYDVQKNFIRVKPGSSNAITVEIKFYQ